MKLRRSLAVALLVAFIQAVAEARLRGGKDESVDDDIDTRSLKSKSSKAPKLPKSPKKAAKNSELFSSKSGKGTRSEAPSSEPSESSSFPSPIPSSFPSPIPSPAIGNFVPGDLVAFSKSQVSPLLHWLSGDAQETHVYEENLLPRTTCQDLCTHIDENTDKSVTFNNDCHLCGPETIRQIDTRYETKLSISAYELMDIIGIHSMISLRNFYSRHTGGAPVNTIHLRRLDASGQHAPFHLDVHNFVLQVPLNDEDEYLGGKLVFLNRFGSSSPPRMAGSAVLHDASRLLHGVSKLIRGSRYGMYLLNDPTLPQICILSQEIKHTMKEVQGQEQPANKSCSQKTPEDSSYGVVGGDSSAARSAVPF